jgi:D-galactarolactone cycloisomerase
MRITKIATFVLKAPLGKERFFSSQAAFPERTSLLVRLETDEGLVGWGEGGQYGPAEPVASVIHDVLAPWVLGSSPRAPAVTWERLYTATRDFGQKGTYVEAISGLDIALWDLFGQSLGVPVHTLLGGAYRDRATAYATGFYYRGDAGFRVLKTKIGLLSVEADAERLARIRAAVGPEVVLLTDANHAYNRATALRMGRALETLNIGWFEEPVVPEDRAGYQELRVALSIPIAGGESEFTRFGFRDLFVERCVDIAQPDTCAAGGFTEMQRILALAAAHNVSVVPHVWGSGIAVAAALQVLAVIPWQPFTFNPVPLQNEPMVEFDRNPNPLRDDLLQTPFALEDGALRIPDGPGLGVQVKEDVVTRFVTESRESLADEKR